MLADAFEKIGQLVESRLKESKTDLDKLIDENLENLEVNKLRDEFEENETILTLLKIIEAFFSLLNKEQKVSGNVDELIRQRKASFLQDKQLLSDKQSPEQVAETFAEVEVQDCEEEFDELAKFAYPADMLHEETKSGHEQIKIERQLYVRSIVSDQKIFAPKFDQSPFVLVE